MIPSAPILCEQYATRILAYPLADSSVKCVCAELSGGFAGSGCWAAEVSEVDAASDFSVLLDFE